MKDFPTVVKLVRMQGLRWERLTDYWRVARWDQQMVGQRGVRTAVEMGCCSVARLEQWWEGKRVAK